MFGHPYYRGMFLCQLERLGFSGDICFYEIKLIYWSAPRITAEFSGIGMFDV